MPHFEHHHRTDAIRIVAPLDFSSWSIRALQWIGAIAAGRKATVIVVHAVDPSPAAELTDAAEVLVARAEERALEACAALVASGISIQTHCAVGAPWRIVREAIDEHGADLMVLGSRGLSSVKRTLLGSSADRILRAVPTPALVVHATDAPREHLRVLIATDFSADAEEAIRDFRRTFLPSSIRLEVRVLHACLPPDLLEGVEVPVVERVDWANLEDEASAHAERVANEFRADGIDTTVSIVRGGASRAILAASRSWRADLIVLGRRGVSGFERLFLGSAAERVQHGAECAVFTAQLAEKLEPVAHGSQPSFIA